MKNLKTHLSIILCIISISGFLALNEQLSGHTAFVIGIILILIYFIFIWCILKSPIFIYAIKNRDLLKICCEINLKKIIYEGSKGTSILCKEIENAKEIKALFVTANNSFLAQHEDNLRDCISHHCCPINW